MKKLSIMIICLLTVVTTACTKSTSVHLEHIHGFGYSADGTQILVPAHTGLVSYSNGQWKPIDTAKHDYMGFTTVDNGFYSSGHPAAGSELKNPIGIVKSSDIGKSLSKLGLEGESDFHAMTVGYKSHAIYVLNEQPNSKMKIPGLYYSLDDAKTWTKSESNIIASQPTAIAAHPTDTNTIVVGNKKGLYVSKDNGNHFEDMLTNVFVSALYFGVNGDLFVARVQSPAIVKLNLANHTQEQISIPALDQNNPILYIAQNPTNEKELAFSTNGRDAFISKDLGQHWTQIAKNGEAISQK